MKYLGPISQTDLSLASYQFVLDLSPKIVSLFVKSAPGPLFKIQILYHTHPVLVYGGGVDPTEGV